MSNFKFQISNADVALVHDSLTQQGGAERVLENFHELFPKAPVYTLAISGNQKENYYGWDIRTSWLQVLFNFFPKLQYYIFLIPAAVRSLHFSYYNVILSSSSSFVKNITLPKDKIHICYCHTPTRFLWSDAEYINQEVPVFLRPIVRPFLSWMKKWDYKGSQHVNYFIANSKEVQKRIKKYYNRDSVVIYPGINTNFWHPVQSFPPGTGGVPPVGWGGGSVGADSIRPEKSNYFLLAGRLQAHKHNDLIIEIFNEVGLPLHVVGTGRQEKYLKSIAKENITFYGRVSDEELREQYSGALGFIYPQLEDAGLMPLEAAACGTATIGLAQGGSLETIIPGVTGELFGVGNGLDRSVLKDEIKQIILSWNPEKYKYNNLCAQAEKFDNENFKRQILEFISNYVKGT